MLDAAIGLRRGDFTLDARFAAPDGVTALFGPSGAGKSTVLAALAGLVRLQSGHIRLGEESLSAPDLHVAPHLREVGLVFQEARLFPHLSVRENLEYPLKRAPAAAPVGLGLVAEHFALGELLNRRVRNLSGGERSKVALARAVLGAPSLLLLDEPFAALDGRRRRDFLVILRRMHTTFALPMIVVTHQIDDAAALADHIVALNHGLVIAQGPFAQTAQLPQFQMLLERRDVGVALKAEHVFRTGATTDVHAWVRADQVLIATVRPEGLSARNVWEGKVTSIVADGASILVHVETPAGLVFSRVTQEALQELGLNPGMPVWLVVKAHSL